jgi:hypothetical protein
MSQENNSPPPIKIKWMRGHDHIAYNQSRITLVLGKKGGGKSAFLEANAMRHRQIIDLLGSRDDEGLSWLRDKKEPRKALLVHGDNVDVDCSWETCKVGNLTTEKMLSSDLIITTSSLYSSQKSKYDGVNQLTELFWGRRQYDPTKPIAVVMRELSDFIFSRISQDGLNIKEAKADFIVFQRQLRHFGYSPYMDTIRWTSVDKEIRDLADYLIIKKVGSQGLPGDIRYLYKFVSPLSLAALPPDKFVIVTENASIGKGIFGLPPFHKEEGIDLLTELGIELTYGEEAEESTTQRVGDKEHAEFVKLYHDGLTMPKIAEKVGRSNSTVQRQISIHDSKIKKLGGCPACTRVGCDLYNTLLSKNVLVPVPAIRP